MLLPQQHLFGGFPYLFLSPPPHRQMISVTFWLTSGWVIGFHGDREDSFQANAETESERSINTCS